LPPFAPKRNSGSFTVEFDNHGFYLGGAGVGCELLQM
jgi:hypothetical protein